jgi:hypothetical protein
MASVNICINWVQHFCKEGSTFLFFFFASASSNSVHPEGALAAGWG